MAELIAWAKKLAEPMTFVTMVLCLATIGLYCATRELVQDGEETARRQLRSYAAIESASIKLDGRTFKSEVDLKNSGQTPAYDLTVVSHLETIDTGSLFTPAPLKEKTGRSGIVGPGTVTHPYAELSVPEENKTTIIGAQKGSVTIYLVGRARYRDIFQRTWVLNFRFELSAAALISGRCNPPRWATKSMNKNRKSESALMASLPRQNATH